jgi:UDP-galactopyranose mutase
MKCDYLIVGAGIFGSVMAERIANDLGAKVLVIDKRFHIGGNCYSKLDQETGIETHQYGTHIFHTSSKVVWEYIGQFAEFNNYHHQVLTIHKNKVYQMPINLETINSFYNLNLKPYEANIFLKKEIEKEGIKSPKNLEEKAISLIGRSLYEAFIKGYTIKQWQKDPKELPPDIIARLPVRYNYREDYFLDARWQGIPLEGYTKLFERLLESPNIHVELNCDYFQHRNDFRINNLTIYTGPIDRYFDYAFGRLEWRTVMFEKKIVDVEDYQGTSVMNYSDLDVKYTRIHEFKHLHPERKYSNLKSVIFYETTGYDPENPFYPINTERNKKLLQKYKELAHHERGVIIGGRLGDYAYYDMDKAILAALNCYKKNFVRKRK